MNDVNDAISRQAAIDALRDWEMCYDWDEHCREEPKEPWVVSPSDVVNKLPPIQPELHWIPVEQELPKIGEYVLCETTTRYFGKYHVCKFVEVRDKNCPLIELPPHGDLVDLSNTVHPNDSMRRMTIDEQLRRTCEGWSADKKQYVIIEAEEK